MLKYTAFIFCNFKCWMWLCPLLRGDSNDYRWCSQKFTYSYILSDIIILNCNFIKQLPDLVSQFAKKFENLTIEDVLIVKSRDVWFYVKYNPYILEPIPHLFTHFTIVHSISVFVWLLCLKAYQSLWIIWSQSHPSRRTAVAHSFFDVQIFIDLTREDNPKLAV